MVILCGLPTAAKKQFDNAGTGGATTAGAIIHETVEQLEKAKSGLAPYDWSKTAQTNEQSPELEAAHKIATAAENKVNGNTRTSNTEFKEANGSTTTQTITQEPLKPITVIKLNKP